MYQGLQHLTLDDHNFQNNISGHVPAAGNQIISPVSMNSFNPSNSGNVGESALKTFAQAQQSAQNNTALMSNVSDY